MIIEWTPTMPMIHGTSEEFSTGSQAQYPPKESVSYAQYPPIAMPTPSTAVAARAQGSAGRTHCVYRRFQSPATANANGAAIIVKPRKRVGGWMTIQ